MIWKVPEVMLQPKNRDLFVLKAKSISSKMAMLSFFVSKFELDVGYLIGAILWQAGTPALLDAGLDICCCTDIDDLIKIHLLQSQYDYLRRINHV